MIAHLWQMFKSCQSFCQLWQMMPTFARFPSGPNSCHCLLPRFQGQEVLRDPELGQDGVEGGARLPLGSRGGRRSQRPAGGVSLILLRKLGCYSCSVQTDRQRETERVCHFKLPHSRIINFFFFFDPPNTRMLYEPTFFPSEHLPGGGRGGQERVLQGRPQVRRGQLRLDHPGGRGTLGPQVVPGRVSHSGGPQPMQLRGSKSNSKNKQQQQQQEIFKMTQKCCYGSILRKQKNSLRMV